VKSALLLLALAQGAPDPIDLLVAARGQEYLAIRDRLLSEGVAPRDPVKRGDWKRALAQEALLFHAQNPTWWSQAQDIPGLDPESYLRRRFAEPTASQTIDDWPATGVLEALVFIQRRPEHPDEAYPEDMSPFEIHELREAEAKAFLQALIRAAGRSRHPLARLALVELLEDEQRPEDDRAASARALGDTGSEPAVDTLARVLRDVRASYRLQEAALIGLGGLSFSRSVRLLSKYVDPERAPFDEIAVTSLGRIGRARGGAPELRREIVAVLEHALKTQPELEPRIVEAFGRLADAHAGRRLVRLAENPRLPADLRARARRAAERVQRVLRRRGP